MEELQISDNLCEHCQNEVPSGHKFCSHCGRAQNYREVVIHSKKWPSIQQVGLFFIIEILCCATSLLIEHSLTTLFCIDAIMGIAALLFFFNSWSENKNILKWPGFSIGKLMGLITATILASIIVTFVVDHLNELVFKKEME